MHFIKFINLKIRKSLIFLKKLSFSAINQINDFWEINTKTKKFISFILMANYFKSNFIQESDNKYSKNSNYKA